MNTVDDLRTALDRYADTVAAPDGASTVHDVETRVERARRHRQAGVIATLAAAALVVATVLGLRGFGPNSTPVPANSPSPTQSEVRHTPPKYFADHANGYRLVKVVDVPLTTGNHTPTTVHVKAPAESQVVPLGSVKDAELSGASTSDVKTKLVVNPSTGPTSTLLVWRRQTLPIAPTDDVVSFRQLFIVSPGTLTLSATTTLKDPRHSMPVAVYAPASWNTYPVGTAPFTHVPTRPVTQPGGNPFPSAQKVVHSPPDAPNTTVKVTMDWPKGAESLLISLLPTTTGRFDITVDGNSACNTAHGWCSFWDSDLSQGGPRQISTIVGKGSQHTITIKAQDTTGPWQVVLTPDGAPKHDEQGGSAAPPGSDRGTTMTATGRPTKK